MSITNDIDSKSNFSDVILRLKSAQSRLDFIKLRQIKRRQVILQYLSRDSQNMLSVNGDKPFQLSNIRRLLGFRKPLYYGYDEITYRKRAILPIISRLKAPVLSLKLLEAIQSVSIESTLSAQECQIQQQSQKWDRFSLEVVGDKLRQTLGSNLSTDSYMKNELSGKDQNNYSNDSFMKESDNLVIKTYTGSAAFLKGTQSANPHNDYCQHFVDTGERPQNFIRDTGLKNRFEEYPKLRELIRLKDQLIESRATPPMYLQADLRTFDLNDLQSKFDVILIEPPLEEYHRMNGAVFDHYWNWDEIERLEIEQIASPRSFVWIWCGSGEGLDFARKCLRKWGFRRCEDICWIKTNANNPGHEALEPGAVFERTKEHCLMGIHGTVRRSTDGDFIHANIDIDLIIEEAPPHGSYAAKDKPTEIFHIIEHFCLGRRRLHLFGRDSTLRPGWLTVGNELSASNFDPQIFANNFVKDPNGLFLGSTEEIERLRPKSPPPSRQNVTNPNVSTNNADFVSVTCANPSLLSTGVMSSHSGYTIPVTCTIKNLGSNSNHFNLISGIVGNSAHSTRRFNISHPSKAIHSVCTQNSLLGLPALNQGTNNRTNTNLRSDNIHMPTNAAHTNMGNSLSSRNLTVLQAAAKAAAAATANCQNVITSGASSLWSLQPNNLAMALAAASQNLSPTNPINPSGLRTQIANLPLIASLIAAGKLNPALLTLLTSSTAGSSTHSILNNLLRGNLGPGKHNQSWR